MKTTKVLSILAVAWQASAWCGSIDKVTLAINDSPNASNCIPFEFDRSSVCVKPVETFLPVQLRSHGKWNEESRINPYLKSLSAADLATLQDYPDFMVQNFAVDTAGHFSVDVTFRYGSSIQTNYVFGEIEQLGGKPIFVVRSYAEKNPQQEISRVLTKNLENIVNQPNFESPRAQVQADDNRRVSLVEPILRAWMASSAKGLDVAAADKSDR